jgi:polyisoprenoid-binding protein YceI
MTRRRTTMALVVLAVMASVAGTALAGRPRVCSGRHTDPKLTDRHLAQTSEEAAEFTQQYGCTDWQFIDPGGIVP